jgi:hypothetical protein
MAVVRRASSDSKPIQAAYLIKISLTVFSSPRRSISSRNARTLRGGTHQASSEASTSFLFSSGTCSQNSWSRSSVKDCTFKPAAAICSSCEERIFRNGLDFRVHAVEQLLYGVDAEFALFVAVESEADRDVFGKFKQHGLVGLFGWRLRRQARQRLLQGHLTAYRHCGEPRLESRRVHAAAVVLTRAPQLREQTEHGADFLFLDGEFRAGAKTARLKQR